MVVVGWLGTATVTTQGLNGTHDTTKSGDFLLATTGDRDLATSGDFFVGHGHRDRRGDPEVEHPLLVISQQPVRFLDEQPQLGLVTRGTHVTNDPTPTRHRLSDLHCGSPRARANSANPGHQPDHTDPN